MFRASQLTRSLDLPELKAWAYSDARLSWRIHSGKYEVNAFSQHVKVEDPSAEKGLFARMYETLTQGLSAVGVDIAAQPRAPPPGSDPSAFRGEEVQDEEDILWVENLPGTRLVAQCV